MTDSHGMASLAFGRRSRTGLVGRVAHGLLGRRGASRPHKRGGHKKGRRPKGFPSRHHRGVTLSNELLTTVITIELIKGLKT